jgi:hypothetical protein
LKHGREQHHSRVINEKDLALLAEAPSYVVGTRLRFQGSEVTVDADLGDKVVLAMPEVCVPTQGGQTLRIAASRRTVAKAEVVLDGLEARQ